jgi:CHAT domain-containing protein
LQKSLDEEKMELLFEKINNLAISLKNQGNIISCLYYCEAALNILDSWGNVKWIATIHKLIALAYLKSGKYDYAEDFLFSTLELITAEELRTGYPQFLDTKLSTLLNFASHYLRLNQFNKCIYFITRSELFVNNLKSKGIDLDLISYYYECLGDYCFFNQNYVEAIKNFHQSLVFSEVDSRDTSNPIPLLAKGRCLRSLGLCLFQQNDIKLAKLFFLRAKDHFAFVNDQTMMADIEIKLGYIYRDQKFFKMEIQSYIRAIEINNGVNPEIDLIAYTDLGKRFYVINPEKSFEYFNSAFSVMAWLGSNLDDEFSKIHYNTKYHPIILHLINLSFLLNNNSDVLFFVEHAKMRTLTEKLFKIESKSNLFISIENEISKLSDKRRHFIDEIQKAIPIEKKTILIEYFFMYDSLLIFLVWNDGNKLIKLDIKHEKYLALFKEYMDYFYFPSENTKPKESLDQYFINPIESLIDNFDQIIFIPHLQSHFFPFSTLIFGGEPLIYKFDIATLPSILLLRSFIRPKKYLQSKNCLAFGIPQIFDSIRNKKIIVDEAKNVSKFFPNGIFMENSSKSEVLNSLTKFEGGIVHFSCHGNFNFDFPFKSGILLEDNDLLTVLDISRLNLSSIDLAVISACDSGQSFSTIGDEMIGITRGFFTARIASIVVSLWKPDIQFTFDFMAIFYKNLLNVKTLDKSNALRKTQLELIKIPKYSHPFYWATFALIGDFL